jgi:hypothetical protein
MTMSDTAAQAAIGAAARELHLPTVRDEALPMAEIALRERQTYLCFLAEVLAAEVDERATRRRTRRITEARFPRLTWRPVCQVGRVKRCLRPSPWTPLR